MDSTRFRIWLTSGLFFTLLMVGMYITLQDRYFPIQEIVLISKLQKQDSRQLYELANQALRGNFFTLDVNAFREQLQTLPWVQRVWVKKKWPGSLYVDIEEKQVAARWINIRSDQRTIAQLKQQKWQGDYLLSTRGDVFRVQLNARQYQRYAHEQIYIGAPQLADKVLRLCRLMQEKLTRVKLEIKKCIQDQRLAWYVKLDNHIELYLGRDIHKAVTENGDTFIDTHLENQVLARTQLFVDAYKKVLHRYQSRIDRIDLRYTNGFAVHWITPRVDSAKQG